MSTAQNDVWIAESVTAKIGSDWYSVSSISVVLQASTIPEIVLQLDPVHAPDQAFVPASASDISTATFVTLADLKAWHDKVQKATTDRSIRAELNVEFNNINPGENSLDSQKIVISDWIVVSSGIVGAGASGKFALEVTIQHPAGLIDKSSSGLGNVAVDMSMGWDVESYEDPISGLAQAFEAWAGFPRTAASSTPTDCASDLEQICLTPEEAVPELQKNMIETAKLLRETLQWNTWLPNNNPTYSKFPFETTCFSANVFAINGIKAGLTVGATPPDGLGIWDAVVSNVLDDFQLTVIPTFWDTKLQVMPFTPWAKPAITVFDDEISEVTLPGVDGAPLGGVKVSFAPTQGPVTDSHYADSQNDLTDATANEICFIPKLKPLSGRVVTASMPSWYESALRGEAAAAGDVTEIGNQEDKASAFDTPENIQEDAQVTPSPPMNESAVDAAGAALRYAAAAFYAQFRSTVEAELNCCLLIESKTSEALHNYVLPGYVLSVKSRAADAVLFDMYVTRVQHYMSAASGEAWTKINGTYARPADGISDVVTIPTYNPLYSPNASGGAIAAATTRALSASSQASGAPSIGLGSSMSELGTF